MTDADTSPIEAPNPEEKEPEKEEEEPEVALPTRRRRASDDDDEFHDADSAEGGERWLSFPYIRSAKSGKTST